MRPQAAAALASAPPGVRRLPVALRLVRVVARRMCATDAAAEVDELFPPERLAAQHAQIFRRLEAAERPARVIAFPKFAQPLTSGSSHGVTLDCRGRRGRPDRRRRRRADDGSPALVERSRPRPPRRGRRWPAARPRPDRADVLTVSTDRPRGGVPLGSRHHALPPGPAGAARARRVHAARRTTGPR